MKKSTQHHILDELRSNHDEITLEELDVILRKCNHLHDEEILLKLSKIASTVKGYINGSKMSGKVENRKYRPLHS